MRRLHAFLVVPGLAAIAAMACTKTNANFCDDDHPCDEGFICNPATAGCDEIGTEPCADSGECDAPSPYCVPNASDDLVCSTSCADDDTVCAFVHPGDRPYCVVDTCGACDPEQEDVATDDCMGTSPHCDATSLECRACASHDECASAVCLDTGACADPDAVLYAMPAGDGDCGQNSQCSLPTAVSMVDAQHIFIKLDTRDLATFTITDTLQLDEHVTIIGDGATIDIMDNDDAPVLTVSAPVEIHGATISGASGNASARGISCTAGSLSLRDVTVRDNAGAGIFSDGCPLDLDACSIENNAGGGVLAFVSSQIHRITNNFVFGNGAASAQNAGVRLAAASGSVIEFNTIAENPADVDGESTGLFCQGNSVTLRNNIIFANTGANAVGQNAGSCLRENNLVRAFADAAELAFVDRANGNYRLTADSAPAIDAGDTELGLSTDHDGDPRDSSPDIGADEYIP
jgi:hypothetical protein